MLRNTVESCATFMNSCRNAQLDHAVLRHEDVLGLEVPVKNTVFVQVTSSANRILHRDLKTQNVFVT